MAKSSSPDQELISPRGHVAGLTLPGRRDRASCSSGPTTRRAARRGPGGLDPEVLALRDHADAEVGVDPAVVAAGDHPVGCVEHERGDGVRRLGRDSGDCEGAAERHGGARECCGQGTPMHGNPLGTGSPHAPADWLTHRITDRLPDGGTFRERISGATSLGAVDALTRRPRTRPGLAGPGGRAGTRPRDPGRQGRRPGGHGRRPRRPLRGGAGGQRRRPGRAPPRPGRRTTSSTGCG